MIIKEFCTINSSICLVSCDKIILPVSVKSLSRLEDFAVPKKELTPGARRVRRLREALGYKSGAEFARFLGISKAHWWNFENNYPIPREMVFLLCEKIDGLTSDWIYFGREQFLTVDLRDKLRQPNGIPPNGPASKRRKRRL